MLAAHQALQAAVLEPPSGCHGTAGVGVLAGVMLSLQLVLCNISRRHAADHGHGHGGLRATQTLQPVTWIVVKWIVEIHFPHSH